jgi:serine/threonine protein kinase
MENEEQIKLADFGFAVYLKGGTQSVVLGSPVYMAPEIVSRQEYGLPVDIWALGIITLILLTGKSPFSGRTKSKIFQEIKFKQPHLPANQLDKDALMFIKACLINDPEKRAKSRQLLHYPFIKNVLNTYVNESPTKVSPTQLYQDL